MDRTRLKLASATLLTIILTALAASPLAAQDSAPPPAAAVSPSPQTPEQTAPTNDQVLRSYLQIQEQLHTALLAIENNREQLEAGAKQNNEMIAARLKLIEQTLTAQGERETKSARSSQRLVLVIAGIFGIVGIGAMVLTSWFQLRSMNRLTELGGSGGFFRQLDAPITTVNAVPPAILEAIQRLEQRLLEYQNARALPEPQSNDNGATALTAHTDQDERDKLTVLLSKGQTLMRLNRPSDALEVFDEALTLDPDNADIYVKKGTALERMKKLDEAVACYDRAIAANASMTLAYLCKGGVFNQMERFAEALECYEQALRSQHKTPAAA